MIKKIFLLFAIGVGLFLTVVIYRLTIQQEIASNQSQECLVNAGQLDLNKRVSLSYTAKAGLPLQSKKTFEYKSYEEDCAEIVDNTNQIMVKLTTTPNFFLNWVIWSFATLSFFYVTNKAYENLRH